MGVYLQQGALGIWTGYHQCINYPISGLGKMSLISFFAAINISGALRSGVFERIGGATFLSRWYYPISCIPIAIGLANECVPESYLDQVESVHRASQRVFQLIWVMSVGYSLYESIVNQDMLKCCYHSGLVAGRMMTLLHERVYITEKQWQEGELFVMYTYQAAKFYNSDDAVERVSTLISAAINHKFIETRNEQANPSGFTLWINYYLIQSRQNRRNQFFPGGFNDLTTFRPDPQIVEAGAKMLREEIYDKMDGKDKKAFIEQDASIVIFISSKVVYLYSIGSKKEEKIPPFFDDKTKKQVEEIRKITINKETLAWFEEHFKTSDNYTSGGSIPNNCAAIRSSILNGGGHESRRLLVKDCWKKAVENLSADQPL